MYRTNRSTDEKTEDRAGKRIDESRAGGNADLVETEEDQRDIRRIILNFEFKEKSFETVKTLHSLIYKSLFENFYDNFIICTLFDDKETSVLKKIEKYFNKFEDCLEKEFNYRISYAGYLKTNNCKTYRDIKKEF